jgi:hypothetical protein
MLGQFPSLVSRHYRFLDERYSNSLGPVVVPD